MVRVCKSKIVREARSWIGTPYHHQASRKHVGCDCLGLILGVYRECIGSVPETIPNYTANWAETGRRELLLEGARRWFQEKEIIELEAGDIVIFRLRQNTVAKHAAILSTRTHMIHAVEGVPASEVCLSNWWRRRVVGVFGFRSNSP